MADIAVSYAREDSEAAQRFVRVLEARHYKVFSDRAIPAGEEWRARISKEFERARAILVLWSTTSVTKSYVREEADIGLRRGVLVPVAIDPGVQAPFGFGELQAIHLILDHRFDSSEAFAGIVHRIRELAGPPLLSRTEAERQIASLPLFRALRDSFAVAPADVVRSIEKYQQAPWFPFSPDRILEMLSSQLVPEEHRGTVEIMAFNHFDVKSDILRAMQVVHWIDRE